jgi:hypothetical protein
VFLLLGEAADLISSFQPYVIIHFFHTDESVSGLGLGRFVEHVIEGCVDTLMETDIKSK